MAATILITGPTGNIGSHLLRLASQRQLPVRAAVRSKAKVASLNLPGVEWVEADFDRPSTFDEALRGIQKVFVLSPFLPTLAEMSNDLIDRAKRLGVKHVVRLSATGADAEPGISLGKWQRTAEKHVQASGLSWTILRPTFFMENILNNLSSTMKAQGKFYLPQGNGKSPYIAARDIAAVALETLTGTGHEGRIYELTGPQSLSNYDIAAILSKVAGRTIAYVDVPEDVARQSMLGSGTPEWMVNTLMELNFIVKQGWTAEVRTTLKDVTGKDATTFEQWATEHKAAWG